MGRRQPIEEHSDSGKLEKASRISSIVRYIVKNFHFKTNPSAIQNQEDLHKKENTFNSMFAVKSIDTAIQYYNEFQRQLQESDRKIKIAVIFSASDNLANEDEDTVDDDGDGMTNMEMTHRDFLHRAIEEYNQTFKCNINKNNFNDYRNDVSQKVKDKEIDLLIVVNMFLTGFDAQRLNTI